jgi:alpha-mannosidase
VCSSDLEPVVNGQVRLTLRLRAEPGHMRVLRIDESGPVGDVPPLEAGIDWIGNGQTAALNLSSRLMRFGDTMRALPRLDLIEDLTDTWSHDVDRYSAVALAAVAWGEPSLVESGPVMSALAQCGRFGRSWVLAEYRVYAGEPWVDLRLRVHWAEQRKVLKLVLPLDGNVRTRRDGVMGGSLSRALDGAERPMRDWAVFERVDGQTVAVLAPEVFAVDATPRRARFTLLRSPRMAFHDPCRRNDPRDRFSDQGEHEFRLRFYAGKGLREQYLDDQALMLHRPLVMADLTRGMPTR